MTRVWRRNNVKVAGHGDKLLLFAHGLGCDQTVWRGVTERLPAGYQLALFDYVGSGDSDQTAYDAERYGSLEGYAGDLIEVAELFEGRRPLVVAHSISASLAVMAAVRRPSLFSGIVLVAPNPRFLNDPPDYVGGLEAGDVAGFLDLMDRNFMGWASAFAQVVAKEPEVVRQMHDHFCATNRTVVRSFAELTFAVDVRALLPAVTIPTLVVQCSDDAVAPRQVGQWMHRQLRGSRYRELDIVGHCPHLSHPELIAEAIRDFAESSA